MCKANGLIKIMAVVCHFSSHNTNKIYQEGNLTIVAQLLEVMGKLYAQTKER